MFSGPVTVYVSQTCEIAVPGDIWRSDIDQLRYCATVSVNPGMRFTLFLPFSPVDQLTALRFPKTKDLVSFTTLLL